MTVKKHQPTFVRMDVTCDDPDCQITMFVSVSRNGKLERNARSIITKQNWYVKWREHKDYCPRHAELYQPAKRQPPAQKRISVQPLLDYMEMYNLSIQQMASRIGVKRETLSRWKHGKVTHTYANRAEKMAHGLGLEVIDLWPEL